VEGGLRGNEGRQACSSRVAQSSWAAGMRMQHLCRYSGRQSFSSSNCVLEEPQSAAQTGLPMLLPTLAKLARSRKCCGASGVKYSRLQET
jgi:hypothetical protein